MTDYQKRINKVIDNLSIKYDFFYIVKNNKKLSITLFIAYMLFVGYILYKIYTKNHFQGIIENIMPFFVDIAIIFLITLGILILRTIYNDENARILENKENSKIIHKKFLNNSCTSVKINFNKNKYYSQPQILQNLLKWVDFDKSDYFRTHYGSLDISKIALEELIIKDDILTLKCSQTSFYDVSFTHYFPDYILSLSSSTDLNDKQINLRELLKQNLNEHYKNVFKTNTILLFDLLPNPLGLTGIVSLTFKSKTFYLLQIRHNSEVAARNKIQWSFAGTIDVVPNLYKDEIQFNDFIQDELFDEIINKEKEFKILKNKNYTSKVIGFVVNTLYLYQPEFFISVEYDLREQNIDGLEKYLLENEKKNTKSIELNKPITDNIIAFSSLTQIKNFIINNENIKRRNLFKPGFDFISKEIHNKPEKLIN